MMARTWKRAAAIGVALAVVTALAVLPLIEQRRRDRLGAIWFTTDGPSTRVQVVDADGKATGPPLVAPDPQPILLVEGTYQAIATRPGEPSLTTTFEVTRGERDSFRLDLSADRMGMPVPVATSSIDQNDWFGFVDFGSRRDLVIAHGDGSGRLSRHDFTTGRTVWAVRWEGDSARLLERARPQPEARRLDDDEEPDAILDGIEQMVAVSGRTGQRLWTARPDPPATSVRDVRWLGDVDNDRVDDLACLVRNREDGALEARSGRDGRRLWRVEGYPGFTKIVPLVVAGRGPEAIVIAGAGNVLMALKAGTGKPIFDPAPVNLLVYVDPVAVDRDGDGTDDHWLIFTEGRCSLFDARNGREAGTFPRPGAPPIPPRWLGAGRVLDAATLPGVGRLVRGWSLDTNQIAWEHPLGMLGEGPGASIPPSVKSFAGFPTLDINKDGCLDAIVPHGVAAPAGAPVAMPFRIDPPRPHHDGRAIVEALDGATGQVLWSRSMRTAPGPSPPTVEAIAGPDTDGDGVPEVFTASFGLKSPYLPGKLAGARQALFVEALSGATGAVRWRWRRDLVEREAWTASASLRWRASGPGTRPALVVSTGDDDPDRARFDPPALFVLRAEDGAMIQDLPHGAAAELLDVDKDGIDDFVIEPHHNAVAGSVEVFRGQPFAPWRRAGKLEPTGDIDGDGADDALATQSTTQGMWIRAVSARDGRTAWRAETGGGGEAILHRIGDADGDGIGEFVLGWDLPPRVLSGRTGRLLISAPVPGGRDPFAALRDRPLAPYTRWTTTGPAVPPPWTADGDGDGIEEIHSLFSRSHIPRTTSTTQRATITNRPIAGPTSAAEASETGLVAIDGRSGAIRWHAPLVVSPGDVSAYVRARPAELDGEPGRDVITLCIDADTPARYRVSARRGRDGHELWSRPAGLVANWPAEEGYLSPILAAVDLDADGIEEVLLTDQVVDPGVPAPADPDGFQVGEVPFGPSRLVLRALEGRDGAERWSWLGPTSPAMVIDPKVRVRAVSLRASRRAEGGPILWVNQVMNDPARPETMLVRRARLDARGQELDASTAAAIPTDRFPWFDLWAANSWIATDPDGDGNDDVVRYEHASDHLEMFRGGRGEPAWRRPLVEDREDVISLRLQASDHPPAIVATLGALVPVGNRMQRDEVQSTFDLATGTPIGPPRWGRHLLGGGGTGTQRQLVVADGMSWIEERGDVAISPPPPGRDPRLASPLPWADGPMTRYVVGSVPFALVLLALPAWALIQTVRKRSLRRAFLAVAAVALAFAAFRQSWLPIAVAGEERAAQWQAARVVGMAFAPIPRVTGESLDPRWIRVVVGLPLVVLIPALVAWRRRWRRVLAGLGLLAGLVALAWWAWDRRSLGPSEYDMSQGWPSLGFWGAYALGLVAVAWSIPLPRRNRRAARS